jgi:NAD(P)-dependent dehydrogenase (short-subunit alcohol dehydrogenase family)
MKTALLVGASRGLGLGLAGELAARGWRVIATARTPAKAKELQALAAGSGGAVAIEQIDVDDSAQLDALAGRLKSERLDLLFLNAGIAGPAEKSAAQCTREEMSQVMWTNAIAPLRIAERLLPRVVDGGTVAFMSSILGSVTDNTSGGYDLYRISKASLNMLARSFAANLPRERQLNVLNLHPGWVRTDMGGPGAPLGIAESVRGLADVLEKKRVAGHRYLDYQGQELPW